MKRYKIVGVNKYKSNKAQTLQSQVQDSVGNEKHMRKHKVKLTISQDKLLPKVWLPLIP